MKHTKGPWELDTSSLRQYGTVNVYLGEYYNGNKTRHISFTVGGRDDDQALANGRLIHAAPDMLEALEEALDNINGDIITKEPGVLRDELERLRDKWQAVINKATGDQ